MDPRALIGDVAGKTVFIVDDEISTAGSLVEAVNFSKNMGAAEVYVAVSHGVYSGPAIERIASLDAVEVASTNTVYVSEEKKRGAAGKLAVLDVAPLFANAISNIHTGESVSTLFEVNREASGLNHQPQAQSELKCFAPAAFEIKRAGSGPDFHAFPERQMVFDLLWRRLWAAGNTRPRRGCSCRPPTGCSSWPCPSRGKRLWVSLGVRYSALTLLLGKYWLPSTTTVSLLSAMT